MSTNINTILYVSDLGLHTYPAFNAAIDLAEKYDAQIIFLHVLEPLYRDAPFWITADNWQEISEQNYAAAQDMITERIKTFFSKPEIKETNVKEPKIRIACDDVSKAILEIAKEQNANLIVMGKHKHTILGQLILGSTADKVVRLAEIPVMLIPVEK